LRIKEGKEEEYVREHQNVWPELIMLIREVGFRNYTIFKRGLNLFVYVEVDNLEHSLNMLINNHIYIRWAERMKTIMEPHPEVSPREDLAFLQEVFHVD
jgi:L-rhamnose mutarotase